jgi:GNAT superfamily N-acetyltransferase
MTPAVAIRPAVPSDAPALGTMHATAWAETYPGLVPAALLAEMADPLRRGAAWMRNLASPMLPGGVLLAEEAGALLGFVSVARARAAELGTEGELTGLYLLRRAQGRGIATALLAAGFAVLRGHGLRSAGAWALVGNRPAERFYAARGAVPGPVRVERHGDHAIRETGWIWHALPGP